MDEESERDGPSTDGLDGARPALGERNLDDGALTPAERELRSSGERPRLVRNKRVAIQVAPASRKLFEGEVKATFLEWFAATANISLSARKAGVHYRTVLRHRMEDPLFAADMERALEVAMVRVRACALELGEPRIRVL